jgi:hypothetical protein
MLILRAVTVAIGFCVLTNAQIRPAVPPGVDATTTIPACQRGTKQADHLRLGRGIGGDLRKNLDRNGSARDIGGTSPLRQQVPGFRGSSLAILNTMQFPGTSIGCVFFGSVWRGCGD